MIRRMVKNRREKLSQRNVTGAAATEPTANKDSPRTSTPLNSSKRDSYVDISQRKDLNNVIPDREPFTSDLDVYDKYIERLKNGVNRSPTASPFNEAVWSHVRKCLALAGPVGFHELDEEGSCELKTNADVMAVVNKCNHFRHLMPIFPNLLAEKCEVPLQKVLTELFYATSIGLVDMVWSPDCKRCGGSVCQSQDVADLPAEAFCRGCGLENKIEYLDGVKVYFVFHPEVFYLPVANFECPHSSLRFSNMVFVGCSFPTSKQSGFSYLFGDENPEQSNPMLKKGSYRLICAYSSIDCYLDVLADAGDSDQKIRKLLKVSQMQHKKVGAKQNRIEIPHGKIRMDLICDTSTLCFPFFLTDVDDEIAYLLPEAERTPFTSATQCIHHPCFRHLFERQTVSDHSSFTVKRVVLVFTDVVGSTAMYEACGDGAALETVKQHFKILFTAVAKSGRVVKTVGDCVMAAFTSGESAIRAVAKGLEDMQTKCLLPSGEPLSIRVGMHSGPALMVALNGINDYFGSTVNVAARVESKALGRECLVTEEVFAEPGAKDAFEELTAKTFTHSRDVDLELKGVDHIVHARGFQLV